MERGQLLFGYFFAFSEQFFDERIRYTHFLIPRLKPVCLKFTHPGPMIPVATKKQKRFLSMIEAFNH
jgi:hypothetical protein